MPLASGARLGPYEIVAPLGAGGMGEVYEARDTRLGRTVAVKVLAPALASDPEFRSRFDREARAISRISHPHICALFDVGHEAGFEYLVLEHLAGVTLAEECRKGPLPIERAMTIALQICDALAAAHRAGVLHRDLKPGNIMLTASGAKLLDFGLAKSTLPAGAPDVAPATATVPLTASGTILGTSQYMAPEQYEGRAADVRTDIWALGCVMYEMLAGRRPFEGPTTASLVSAIIAGEPPPLPALAHAVPAPIDAVIRGCLVKDPELRWQDVRDVRRALEQARAAQLPGAAPPRSPRWLLPGAAAAAVLALLAVAALFALRGRPPAAPALVRFDLTLPAPAEIPRFTDTRPYFAVSPDGSSVAIASSSSAAGRGSLWVRSTHDAAAHEVPGTAGGEAPFWSPDSRTIGFFGDGQLRTVSLDGAPPRSVCRVVGNGWNGTWAPDDTMLFAEWGMSHLMRVPAGGGTPVAVRTGNNPQVWPAFLPDGRHFLFNEVSLKDGGRIVAMVGSLDSPEIVELPGISSRMDYSEGRLLFWRDGTLLAQPFDAATFRLSGTPEPLASHVRGFNTTGFAAFSVAGGLLVYQAGTFATQLQWMDRQGRPLEAAGPEADYVSIALSPDQRSVALGIRDPDLGTNDIVIHDLARNATRPLTRDPRTENVPVWTPDGRTIVYAADRTGAPSLFARNADGTGDERAIVPPVLGGPQRADSITPDGKAVIYSFQSPGFSTDIWLAPLDGAAAPRRVVQTKVRESTGRVSPDSRWVAYVSDQSGRSEVYVQPLDGSTAGAGRQQVSETGGTSPRWRGDGRELFFLEPLARERLFAAEIAVQGTTLAAGPPRQLINAGRRLVDYDVTSDGQRFLLSRDAPREAGALSAALNWKFLWK